VSNSPSPVPTPRFYSVLGAAAENARAMGHSHLGVEHLFLAIIHDHDAVPTQVLAGMADLNAVETALLDLMTSDAYKTGTTATAWDRP